MEISEKNIFNTNKTYVIIVGSVHYISTNFKKTLWDTSSNFPDFISLSALCK